MSEVIIEQIAMGAKPDPYKFTIVQRVVVWKHTIILARYDGCLTFDGLKLMVFKGDYNPVATLDPHFLNTEYPLIGRFQPTDRGWVLAKKTAQMNYMWDTADLL